ncbi:MAG: formylglycine-generating enzyme family protein [Cyanothece sp. SIO1E1]|nr:formylglycine-generating enzyme family protein [Cyanothece sp. SIO1E1]
MPPRNKLPGALKGLADRNAAQVRHDPDFHQDMNKLITKVESYFDGLNQSSNVASPRVQQPKVFSDMERAGRQILSEHRKYQGEVAQNQLPNSFTENLGNGVTLEMVRIPAGSFMMGSPKNEEGRYSNEGPRHQVSVPEFYMGKHQVTQVQWKAVSRLSKVNRALKPDPSGFKGDTLPVECIDWYEAVEFCDRLSNKTRKTYRLPSEAEWEYACRAGTKTRYHFGNEITPELANYEESGKEKTTPVGSYRPNAFGVYDMHGNVWEWCLDHWHDNYQSAPTDGSPWLSSEGSNTRVRRGGSWSYDPWDCRSAYRFSVNPVFSYDHFGFRVVCAVRGTP